ncbi:hypothetical protein SAMN06265379_105200 [Saccharicrinis carchari]|uniref:Uncharacterized protein n=1 Tax=Saccharicrinis carchari TaxID=1168039 RepID=A0A521DHY4_SACCC|nr:hypothetical protein [Saccharicrinis carchari]SMO71195.1 hypothetical protein SAMN06265379_105200 [Saccharicrinis carchari]
MSMQKHLILLIAAIFIGQLTYAQLTEKDPFEKMNRAYEARRQAMEQDYAKRMQRMQKDYDDKMKRMNAAFESYLKRGFKEVAQTEKEVKPVEVPKPIDQPRFEPKVDASLPDKVDKPAKFIAPKIVLEDAPAYSIAPPIASPEGMEKYKQSLKIDFFGSAAPLFVDSRTSSLKLSTVKPKSFASYWDDFTDTYYPIYIESLHAYAQQTNLNDWGIYQLIDKSAKQLFTSSNNRTMWKWAMLNQAGYQAKIGYSANTVYLMLPFMQQVFERPYYSIAGTNYYLIDKQLDKKKIYTYEDNFGGAARKIDLHLPYSLNFTDETNAINKGTKLPNDGETLTLPMDKTVMAFLASYPQTDNTVYLNAAMQGPVKDKLYTYIQTRMDGMTETEAVSYLLNYLHNSFEYKTDRDQFGKEKMFFPDEIFYYPYSDCEDRTVLFTRLVSDLLGLDVVALTYFSHMAAAVSFTRPVEGYSFEVAGQTYTICDPTFINAPIGAVMPEFEGYQPIAIKINNNRQSGNMWQMIAQWLQKDNEGKIFIGERQMAENGKYIASGWFQDNVIINGRTYRAAAGTRDLWFATFDATGLLEWFVPLQCSNYAFSQAFNLGKQGNVYALINYAGSIGINQQRIGNSESPAHLMLGLSNKGQAILSESINFKVPEGKKLAFYGKYRPDGTKIDLLSFPINRVRFASDITVDSNNEVVVRGIVGEIEGLTKDVPITMSAATYRAEDQLELHLKNFQKLDVNRHMASLFAAIKLLSKNGGSMSGLTVRNLLQKHNPNFRKQNPDVYKGLLSMQFVANKGGVVQVETYKGKKVSLFSMRIQNNSNLQIIETASNAYQLKFLNGVHVGKAIVWYKLNSVSLAANGDMLFDYDRDHSKKMVNINEVVE